MREILNMIFVLSLICGLSGLTLASIKQATAPKIEEQKLTFVQGPAIRQVFERMDNDPVKDRKAFALPGGGEVIIFPAMADGKLAGVAFEAFGDGFGGELGVMIGIDITAHKLSGIGITTMKETPGIGSRVAGHGFTAQFQGHELSGLALASQGGDIDAVSGATVSSGAAMQAITKGVDIYESLKDEIAAQWPNS
ncbi:MAG: RnfABCDGE type electron transport complex subunit G [Desulfovibrionaceae bacterium]